MKKISLVLKKCKTFSFQPEKSSPLVNPRSKSEREESEWDNGDMQEQQQAVDHQEFETVVVGRTKKQYVVSSKYLQHPLLNALIDKSTEGEDALVVRCEVVLFDHLLWMIENADPTINSESLEELAELYEI